MAMSQQYAPPVNKYTGSYTEDADGDGIRMNAFGHEDADISTFFWYRRIGGVGHVGVCGAD